MVGLAKHPHIKGQPVGTGAPRPQPVQYSLPQFQSQRPFSASLDFGFHAHFFSAFAFLVVIIWYASIIRNVTARRIVDKAFISGILPRRIML